MSAYRRTWAKWRERNDLAVRFPSSRWPLTTRVVHEFVDETNLWIKSDQGKLDAINGDVVPLSQSITDEQLMAFQAHVNTMVARMDAAYRLGVWIRDYVQEGQ